MRPTCSNAFGGENGYEILLVWVQDNRYVVGVTMVLKIRVWWGYRIAWNPCEAINFNKSIFVRLNDQYKNECGQWIDHFIYGVHLKHFSIFFSPNFCCWKPSFNVKILIVIDRSSSNSGVIIILFVLSHMLTIKSWSGTEDYLVTSNFGKCTEESLGTITDT